jgi:hypothetical protein
VGKETRHNASCSSHRGTRTHGTVEEKLKPAEYMVKLKQLLSLMLLSAFMLLYLSKRIGSLGGSPSFNNDLSLLGLGVV